MEFPELNSDFQILTTPLNLKKTQAFLILTYLNDKFVFKLMCKLTYLFIIGLKRETFWAQIAMNA